MTTSISREMIDAAGRAKALLGASAGAVAGFYASRLCANGGFPDRAGKSDLYYTVFGIQASAALGAALPVDRVAAYLASFGTGGGLDLLHLSCLARCWASLPGARPPAGLREEALGRLAACRTPDGGYAQQPGAPAGSAYGCFLALGTYQDVGADLPDPGGCAACLEFLAVGDGSYANDAALLFGSVPATAAAVTVLRHLHCPVPPEAARWLIDQQADDGGFLAVPVSPESDLLSTATALHALALLGADLSAVRGPCLRFVQSLRKPDGSFSGHLGDDVPDCEYTCYALLALGHLAGEDG